MTKEEQDRIKEELNKAFALSEEKKAAEKEEKPESEKPASVKKEQKAEAKPAPAKKKQKAEAKPASAKKEKKVDAKPAPAKKKKKADAKPAHEKKEKKKTGAKKDRAVKLPEKKTEVTAPKTREEIAASAIQNTPASSPESIRVGRSSRVRESGKKHEKTGSRKKEKRGCLKWVLLAAALMLVVGAVSFVFFRYRSMMHLYTASYIAGTSKDAPVYTIEKDGAAGSEDGARAVEAERLVRGTQVKRYADRAEIDGVTYIRIHKTLPGVSLTEGTDIIEDSGKEADALYVREDNLVSSQNDIVQEKEVFVRTPATVYTEETGPAIESFAPKGSRLEVMGFDKVRPDGSINKYHVKFTDEEGDTVKGYVYGRYMVDTQEKADAVYNENGIADKVSDDDYGYDLYGGRAANLDFYPFERPELKGNEFCEYARAMYVNCEAAVNYRPWVDVIEETDCNAVVIDIKDGVLAYRSDVAKELSPSSYETAYVGKDEYRKGIEAYKETGAYLIGRIVVFNDPIYAKDHPENCIEYGGNTTWPSAYSRDVWEYNVRLAQEAVKEFGFDEIQFDYVRFPENAFEMSKAGNTDFRNVYGEEKGQAIQNVCMYAADQIHDAGAWFSVDVFGESAYGYMTAYGQYWAGISNVVDAISAMPYTDHMGVEGGWEDPYGIMNSWGNRAAKQQEILEKPAVARTWITGYDTPHWAPSFVYGTAELKAQIAGLEDAGLDGGFIPWNAVSSIEKYTEYQDVWNEEQ